MDKIKIDEYFGGVIRIVIQSVCRIRLVKSDKLNLKPTALVLHAVEPYLVGLTYKRITFSYLLR